MTDTMLAATTGAPPERFDHDRQPMFDFRFPAGHVDEGFRLVQGIGADMIPLAGYLDYEVIRDAKDPGHMMVNTLWESEKAAWAVLDRYRHSDKIQRATALMGSESPGFVGEVGR